MDLKININISNTITSPLEFEVNMMTLTNLENSLKIVPNLQKNMVIENG